MKTKILSALTLVMVLSMIASSVLAAPAPPAAQSSGSSANTGDLVQDAEAGSALYIVQLKDAPLASYYGGVESLAPTSPRVTGERKLNMESAASQAYMAYLDGVQAATLANID